jgi:ribulose-5-phosphate 4-epimerase/fuculose-1-phosphate aldolase
MSGAEKLIQQKDEFTPAQVRARRKRDCALGYRLLAAQRWGDLGDGHISARDPERTDCFWMLRYGVSYHAAKVSDLVLVGPDGSLIEGEGAVNVAGYYIHQPILAARPDAVSAVHVHTGWGTPFSSEARLLEPITQEACMKKFRFKASRRVLESPRRWVTHEPLSCVTTVC